VKGPSYREAVEPGRYEAGYRAGYAEGAHDGIVMLVGALLSVEWNGRSNIEPRGRETWRCPECGEHQPRWDGGVYGDGSPDHEPGCIVDIALTKAGYPDQASRDAARSTAHAADGGDSSSRGQ
jgi:hypothetical protein